MNRVINLLIVVAILAAVVASFSYLELDMASVVGNGGLAQMGEYARRFLSPDLSTEHLRAVGKGALETLAMSGLGTLLAMVLGLLLALPAAGRFGWPLQGAARLLLNALRAIPELVWAALTVLAAGLGPNAGTLALALHTAGVLGRLFAEALENAPAEPAAAIRLNNSLKSLPSRGGGRKYFPFFISCLQSMTSFRFARFRILSCLRPQSTLLSPRFWPAQERIESSGPVRAATNRPQRCSCLASP